MSLTARIWVPPSRFMIALPDLESNELATNENKSGMFKSGILQYGDLVSYNLERLTCAKVLHCYTPQSNGELYLQEVGEIITEVVPLLRGWCKV